MPSGGQRTFVGFGLGPIQTGLFIHEAERSGAFDRIVVAEVSREVVGAARACDGRLAVNIASADGVRAARLGPVEVLDPADAGDRETIIAAIAEAAEAATAIPSTSHYATGGEGSIHRLLARGIERRGGDPLIVYAAENHTEAAQVLRRVVLEELGPRSARSGKGARSVGGALAGTAFVNTVIGKMSGVIRDRDEIAARRLEPLAAGLDCAHLVESFNRILIDRPVLAGGEAAPRGLAAFEEKDDLRPFEEAKLHGHNAAHALASYLALARGARRMAELRGVEGAVPFVRAAFIEEAGAALIRRHAGKDPLFAPEAFRAHVDDLIDRMLNPHLGDLAERVGRDPARKLGFGDRLAGTMRLALEAGVRPRRFGVGAAAALDHLLPELPPERIGAELERLWSRETIDGSMAKELVRLVEDGARTLQRFKAGAALA